ncbi:hypothetical protein Hanom_Chr13g01245351 [Helianthus anomalus]
MGIRVLSGVHFLEVLAYLLPLCNKDTGPVTPALIFRGVTRKTVNIKHNMTTNIKHTNVSHRIIKDLSSKTQHKTHKYGVLVIFTLLFVGFEFVL